MTDWFGREKRDIQKVHISASEIESWRALISCFHLDPKFTESEKGLFLKFYDHLELSEKEYDVLTNDLIYPKEPKAMLGKIQDPKDKAKLIYIVQSFLASKNKFDSKEKEAFKPLLDLGKESFMTGLIQELRAEKFMLEELKQFFSPDSLFHSIFRSYATHWLKGNDL